MYEYKIRYKQQKRHQLEALTSLRTSLIYAVTLTTLLYALAFCWTNYESPFEDLYVISLGMLLFFSLLSLVICCVTIKKKRIELGKLT